MTGVQRHMVCSIITLPGSREQAILASPCRVARDELSQKIIGRLHGKERGGTVGLASSLLKSLWQRFTPKKSGDKFLAGPRRACSTGTHAGPWRGKQKKGVSDETRTQRLQ